MKKNVLRLVLIVCFVGVAATNYGQGKLEEFMSSTTPEERAQMQTNYMKESLTLSTEQVPKIHEINLKYSLKMQNAYNAGGGKLQKLKKMKGIGAEKDKEIKKVLNTEQYSTYEKNKEETKDKIRERAKERRNG
jgi:ERCC4-type nuclease